MKRPDPEIETYQTPKGIRWRAVENISGKKTGNGGQAYSRRRDMEQGMLDTANAILLYLFGTRVTNKVPSVKERKARTR
jgi:hypothetical protein